MLKVERQDLSWQPYCEHIIQSNPHLNPKQCTRRKTGKTKQQQGVREEEICKNSPPPLDRLQTQRQGHCTITPRKDTEGKGRNKLSKWVCSGLVCLSVKVKDQHKHIVWTHYL